MLWWFAQTTMVAAGLAALAMLAGRSKRLGPEAKHALWLVVLIKLMIPPVVAWPWALPDTWPSRAEIVKVVKPPIEDVKTPVEVARVDPKPIPLPDLGPAPDIETIPTADPIPEPTVEAVQAPVVVDPSIIEIKSPVRPSRPWSWSSMIIGIWLAGSVLVVSRRAVRAIRFRRSLRGAIEAPEWLMDEVRSTAKMLGVRPPPVKVSSGVSTPLLWCLGRPTLVLPEVLVDRLSADRWPGILAHELAHLSRRDHWVVRLELAGEAIWWWSPLFRLVRDRLREEAELACDARVVRALPDRRFAYAEALVDVCEHLIRPVSPPSPALGVVGPRASRALEGRLLMILKGPDRRPSTRLAASASLLLVAMTLPAWTLGQQPEPAKVAEPPKVETPAKVADEAQVAPPKVKQPIDENPAIPAVLQMEADLYKRQESLKNLSVRYVATTRSDKPDGHRVSVQAADVQISEERGSRLDVYYAKVGESNLLPWSRWLEIRSNSDVKSLRADSSTQGPVPFRWKAEQRGPFPDQNVGLSSLFTDPYSLSDHNPRTPAWSQANRRPIYAVDLAGPTIYFLRSAVVEPNIVGTETIDGREVVRVAWVARGEQSIRGIAWYAPSLGLAMVRADAVMVVGSNALPGRLIWRKKCDDFAKVGDLWLPGKVTTRVVTSEANGKISSDVEQRILLEDYRVNADLPADALDAKLPVQALDDLTGDFTTIPPASAHGLVDRLKRAVAESPFGPPDVPRKPSSEEQARPEPDAYPDVPAVAEAAEALEKAQAELDAIVRRSRSSTEPEEVEARKRLTKAEDDFRQIGEAKLKEAEEKKAQVDEFIRIKQVKEKEAEAKVKAPKLDPEDLTKVELRFKADPEVKALAAKIAETQAKLDEAARKTHDLRDPLVLTIRKKMDVLQGQWAELWEAKRREFRESDLKQTARANEEATDAKSIRDRVIAQYESDPEIKALRAKVAETQAKYEEARQKVWDQHRDPGLLAIKKSMADLQHQLDDLWLAKSVRYYQGLGPEEAAKAAEEAANAKLVRDRVIARFEADPEVVDIAKRYKEADAKWRAMAQIKDVVGEPSVLAAQEKRDELRKQYDKFWESKSRLIGEQVTDEIARGVPAGPVEAGDTVKLAQARRDGKLVEVVNAEAQLKLARSVVVKNKEIEGRKGVIDYSPEEMRKAEAVEGVAEAELAVRKAELAEADEMLAQAKRRSGRVENVEAGDAVKIAQARRDGKVAEVARAEAQRRLALAVVAGNKALIIINPNYVSKKESQKGEAELAVADAELAKKKAELAEADAMLEQAKRSPERAEAVENRPASSSKLIDLRDAVDLLKIQLDGKKAEVEGLDAALHRAEVERDNTVKLAQTNAVSKREVELFQANVAIAQSNVSAKKAEVSEYELRLKQAIRRAEAEETRLKRESARAKAELDRVTPMVKSGQAAFFLFDGARNRYDELMFQLDPNHVATPDVKP